jgi:ubiquinone/menaquinone biosynthesis C-methylase UbiE
MVAAHRAILHSGSRKAAADQLVALADVREGERVLDVACGTGIVARHAVGRTGASGAVVGLDLNADMLSGAHRVCRRGRGNDAFAVFSVGCRRVARALHQGWLRSDTGAD